MSNKRRTEEQKIALHIFVLLLSHLVQKKLKAKKTVISYIPVQRGEYVRSLSPLRKRE